MKRRWLQIAALATVIGVSAIALPFEQFLPEPDEKSVSTDDPVLGQLCGVGSLYARLITRVARLHFESGGTKTPAVLIARVRRLQRLCGHEFALPEGFEALACQVPQQPPYSATCPGSRS